MKKKYRFFQLVTMSKAFCYAVIASVCLALAACGGGDSSAPSPVAQNTPTTLAAASSISDIPTTTGDPHVIPHNATFQGKTYSQWSVSFWQWAMKLPLSNPPHPFTDCNNRPISAAQTGNVWYWSAPDLAPLTCNQTATIIPAGTAIFLTMLDVEASSLDDPPFYSKTADGQRAIANFFANHILDLFCTIDGTPVTNITAYRTATDQFSFFAPDPWIFEGVLGGNKNGTSVADGYYLMLEPLSAGSHIIHYGGRFHFAAGELGPGVPETVIPKDVTLLITVGS